MIDIILLCIFLVIATWYIIRRDIIPIKCKKNNHDNNVNVIISNANDAIKTTKKSIHDVLAIIEKKHNLKNRMEIIVSLEASNISLRKLETSIVIMKKYMLSK